MRLGARIEDVAVFGKDAVPDLQAMLTDTSPDTRKVAVMTLGRMAPQVPEATLALTDALRYSVYPDVRRRVADAISDSPPPATQAVPALVRALKDEDARVRRNAAASLGVILHASSPARGAETRDRDDPEIAVAVTALADALRDDDDNARVNALEASGMMGPAAKSAGPALLDALKDGKVKRESVESILKRIDPEAANRAGFK
jgi:HEAT repeat protein